MLRSAQQYVRSNVVAFLALFVALGGTGAYAANEWNGSNIQDETLTGDDVRGNAATATTAAVDGTLKGEDIQDGTLNSKDVGIGGINGSRILDDTVTTDDIRDNSIAGIDVQNGSLPFYKLEWPARRGLVQSERSQLTIVDHDRGTVSSGNASTVMQLAHGLGGGNFTYYGHVTLTCDEDKMTVTLSNDEDGFQDAGQQRAWIDTGAATAKMDVLQPGEDLPVLTTTVASPTARRLVIHVQSIKREINARFALVVARIVTSSRDVCYWHGVEVNETG